MARIAITDFQYGLDRRRPRVVGVPGTLWVARNVHLSRGGDIERAKKFVQAYGLPVGTFGLGQSSGQLTVWGSGDHAVIMPAGVEYQRLQEPSGNRMVEVLHHNTFDGKHYVIAEYDQGSIHHFYDGVRIPAWDAISSQNSDLVTLSEYLAAKVNSHPGVSASSYGSNILVAADVPGVGFTLTADAIDASGIPVEGHQTADVVQVQANVVEVVEARPVATVTITGGTSVPSANMVAQINVAGVNTMDPSKPVNWQLSNTSTANAVAMAINAMTEFTGYEASPDGATIRIRPAPGEAWVNDGDVFADLRGNVTANISTLAGGVTASPARRQIVKVTLGGSDVESGDLWRITVNGTPYESLTRTSAQGTSCFTYKGREWITARSLLFYSALNNPSDFVDPTPNTGAGFINVSSDSEGNERLVAMCQYQDRVAVFSRRAIRIYELSTDSDLNEFKQTLENIGTIAARSPILYTNTDTLFLDESGVRSLRVRDLTGGAEPEDTGSPIDTFLAEWMQTVGELAVSRAISTVEPVDGRYMLAMGNRIFVLSHFPKGKVSAWSYYEPGFVVSDFARIGRRLYARDDHAIYIYGGFTGDSYPDEDEQVSEVELPFVSAGDPAAFKQWHSMDMACIGTWNVAVQVDPNDETKQIEIGNIDRNTFDLGDVASVGEFPMLALKMRCHRAGFASISSVVLHYDTTVSG